MRPVVLENVPGGKISHCHVHQIDQRTGEPAGEGALRIGCDAFEPENIVLDFQRRCAVHRDHFEYGIPCWLRQIVARYNVIGQIGEFRWPARHQFPTRRVNRRLAGKVGPGQIT